MSAVRLAVCFLSFVILSGCATGTGFVPASAETRGYGYKIEEAGASRVATYQGNAKTARADALAFCFVAAFEYCHASGRLALPEKPVELSRQESYTAVNSYQTYSPKGLPTTNISSYPVTDVYPRFATAFTCFEHIYDLKGIKRWERISRELVHPVTKDFKGGLLINELVVAPDQPLKESDVITAIAGKRVENFSEIKEIFETLKPGPINVSLIRAQKLMTIKAELVDETAIVKATAKELLRKACERILEQPLPAVCLAKEG